MNGPTTIPHVPAPPAAVGAILDAYEQGNRVLLLHGRSLRDLDAVTRTDGTSALRPLIVELRDQLRARHGMALLIFRLSTGLDWDEAGFVDRRDLTVVRALLRFNGLPEQTLDQAEQEQRRDGQAPRYPDTVQIVRGLSRLLATRLETHSWSDGRPVRAAVLIEFSEHVAPGHGQSAPSEAQLAVAEMVALLSSDLAMRKSGNLLLLHGRPGLINDLVTQSAPQHRLPQPAAEEKRVFIAALRARYPDVALEPGLSWDEVANLTANTPNAGLEAQVFAAQRRGQPVIARALIEQKIADVTAMSEGSLSLLDPAPVDASELVGRNIRTAAKVLTRFAAGLAAGDLRTPLTALLAGPPSTGKTMLARLTAQHAKAAAFRMNSPKRPWVGETERIVRLQMDILLGFAPTLAFVDEITEALPMGSQDLNTDSGASQAVQATLLEALADDSRRGKVLTIGATNKPWAMEPRMRSRFVIVPVLQPLREDLPAIILALARRAARDPQLALAPDVRQAAADLFFAKGANPRTILERLSDAALGRPTLTPDDVLAAARNYLPERDVASAAYGDLWAVAHTRDRTFLPWHGDPHYPLPAHLQDVVDPATGEIDAAALSAALERWDPHAGA